MTVVLLTTKLHMPPVRLELVPRRRLMEQLNAGLHRKLILISAPAGFGKTTLVAEWVEGGAHPFAWLSLDERDNDPARFLTYLLAALQGIDASIGRSAQAMPQGPQPAPPEVLLSSLINDIAATPHPFVLILDDYHLIQSLVIHQQIGFLLEHQPDQMHLVIASREDPLLPLSRLRARGQMVEIRQADLQFTPEEAAEFLCQTMQLELSPSHITALQQRTEGWIAGLQLAALSIRGTDDVPSLIQSFTGSHRYILDYLIEEVFERQPADVQDFLLRTSVLDRFTASLCDAVTGRDDSGEVLLALEQGNLFIVPLDEARQWYRYHRLFGELLVQQLRIAGMQDLAPQLHRRASRWFEAAGSPDDAVHHALKASDWERAAALILDNSEAMLKRGEVTTLLGWFRALPDDALRASPKLCYEYSWPLILAGQITAAESYLGQAEQSVHDDAFLLGSIAAAQAYIARARGDGRRTIELSQRALSLLPSDAATQRSVVAVNLGIALWSSGQLAEAEQALEEADRTAQQSGNTYARLTALNFLGAIRAAWGRLHQAAESLQRAIRVGEGSPAIALAHNTLSALLYEWNDLEAAAQHVQQGIELSQRSGNAEVQIGSYRTLALLKQGQGDGAAALDAVGEAHRLARSSDVPPLMHIRNAACHVRVALAQGDLAAATRWAEQVTEDADAAPFYPLLGLTPVRLHLARGEREAAADALEALYDTAAGAGWQYGMVEVRVLQALAAPTPSIALAFLADALTMAQPAGYMRTFLDKGESMAELVRMAAAQGIAPDYVSRLLAAFDGEAEHQWRMPTPVPFPLSSGPRPSPLVDPLSERELEVLQLLTEGQTYREIAQALLVSVNTVKTHLKNIYSKLGVRSRREAAAEARSLGLIAQAPTLVYNHPRITRSG
jgi:LuxR family maltose regulon positive regulatory protein